MTTFFCNVPHAEPHDTTQASIVVSTLHAPVETTTSYNDYQARKPHSCLMPASSGICISQHHGNQRSNTHRVSRQMEEVI
jgi:hypothetical protein